MNSNEDKLLKLLKEVLEEEPKYTYKDNYSFHCPKCKHRKRKLEINLKSDDYHCWVCDFKGKNLHSLFKYVKASSTQFRKLNSLKGYNYSSGDIDKEDLKTRIFNSASSTIDKTSQKENNIILPRDAKSIYQYQADFDHKNALNYLLKDRGFLMEDLIRYNVMYMDRDSYKYANRILVPSYNIDGNINYFFTRTFYEHNGLKNINSPGERRNIIFFENFLDFNHPLTIVEGGFDAMKVRINSTPTLSKVINDGLLEKIIFYNTPINLMYDYDVFFGDQKMSKKLIDQLEYLLNHNIFVKIIKLPYNSDPGDLSFTENQNLIKKEYIELTNRFLMKLKLNI